MEEDTKVIEKDIKTLEEKIDDELLCSKVANAVYTAVPGEVNSTATTTSRGKGEEKNVIIFLCKANLI